MADPDPSLEEAIIRFEMLVKHGVVVRNANGKYEITHEGAREATGLYIATLTRGDNSEAMLGAAIEILKSRGLLHGEGSEDMTQEIRLTPLGGEIYLKFLLHNLDPMKPVTVEGFRELLEEDDEIQSTELTK